MSAADRRGGWRELALVVIGAVLLTTFLTWPLPAQLGTAARADNADTRMLIWNVAWVARTLVVDPLNVFHANIFHPHRWTLIYSESNLGAGALAIPAYWTTRNPFAAYNSVVLLSFVLSATATYYLVRYLVNDRRAAAVAAVCFAYSPYLFSHLPHVHLLMTAGLPLSLLAFHRLADTPSPGRGATLGIVLAAQAYFCGYYGIFAVLAIGCAALLIAALRWRWTERLYWTALAVGAVAAVAAVLPLFVPYMNLQRTTGFARPLEDSLLWSATWRTYLASSAYAHRWLLPIIRDWNEVLFPGFVALTGGLAGAVVGWRARGRLRETSILYSVLGLLALWASFGPHAGLYTLLYEYVPAFNFLHAPSRFGIIVALALCVLTGLAVARWLARVERNTPRADDRPAGAHTGSALALAIGVLAVAELKVPLSFPPVPPTETAYRVLATLPPGPVIEIPFYSQRFAVARTQYMLNSTAHWMPLVNAFSSFVPPELVEKTPVLGGFPSRESFDLLAHDDVRYAVFHMYQLDASVRADLVARLQQFSQYLARRYADDRIWLYEIVDYPPAHREPVH